MPAVVGIAINGLSFTLISSALPIGALTYFKKSASGSHDSKLATFAVSMELPPNNCTKLKKIQILN